MHSDGPLPPSNLKEPLVELHKFMARPPGCSFLGATAAHVPVTVNSPMENPSDIIINSGSDITLISMKTLNALVEVPKDKRLISYKSLGRQPSQDMLNWISIFVPRKDWSKSE